MPNNHTQQIVNKAWSFAHVLRDDGLSYMAYTEQITFLLFLKMAYEQTQLPWNRDPIVPEGLDWPSLLKRDGEEFYERECQGRAPPRLDAKPRWAWHSAPWLD